MSCTGCANSGLILQCRHPPRQTLKGDLAAVLTAVDSFSPEEQRQLLEKLQVRECSSFFLYFYLRLYRRPW
jgi:hypothetical protein